MKYETCAPRQWNTAEEANVRWTSHFPRQQADITCGEFKSAKLIKQRTQPRRSSWCLISMASLCRTNGVFAITESRQRSFCCVWGLHEETEAPPGCLGRNSEGIAKKWLMSKLRGKIVEWNRPCTEYFICDIQKTADSKIENNTELFHQTSPQQLRWLFNKASTCSRFLFKRSLLKV